MSETKVKYKRKVMTYETSENWWQFNAFQKAQCSRTEKISKNKKLKI